MDTGFGAILVRFEKAFGDRITNFILALIGIATTVFCGSIIWTIALHPVVTWLSTLSIGLGPLESLIEIAWFSGAITLGFGAGHLVSARFGLRKLRAEIKMLKLEKHELEQELQGIDETLSAAGV